MNGFDRSLLDAEARGRLVEAERLAAQLGHAEVDAEHVLLAGLDGDGALRGAADAAPLLREELLFNLGRKARGRTGSPRLSSPLTRVLRSLVDGDSRGCVRWGDLVGAIGRMRGHEVTPIVIAHGLDLVSPPADGERETVAAGKAAEGPAVTESLLARFCSDLTARAARGEIDPVIGRGREIRRVAAILGRRESNNAILVGDAGTGKTKLVEGLALTIARGEAAPRLAGKVLLALDLGQLVSGTEYRGTFEARLTGLLRELRERRGEVILFVDEIHQLLGLGKTSGAMDAANLMKPALARGEIWCVGATTFEEYRQIEKDPALRRRFRRVDVAEPGLDETIQILSRVAPLFEEHHGVRFRTESLRAIARLARRHLGDAASPAREIGLLDEIGSDLALLHAERKAASEARREAPRISPRDVERHVSAACGVPIERLDAGRRRDLADVAARLARRVFGQDEVVGRVAASLLRGAVGLQAPGRPRAVLLFAGPSGVGKTELAKAIAEEMFGREEALVGFDMSALAAPTARNRLVGSDPGFVGYEEGGQLTERIRRQPHSLVLLDEWEKAHPEVWRLFLQVFDEGRLTDGQGRTAKFEDTIIVMTSNVGTDWLGTLSELRARIPRRPGDAPFEVTAARAVARALAGGDPGLFALLEREVRHMSGAPGARAVRSEDVVREALLALPSFPPELFGRIGSTLVFRPLTRVDLARILDRLLVEVVERLALQRAPVPSNRPERSKWLQLREAPGGDRVALCQRPGSSRPAISIMLERAWYDSLLDRGVDPAFGARALRDLFENEVETALASEILRHGSAPGPFAVRLARASGNATGSASS